MDLPDFWWFPESSSVELARRIHAAGPNHRLEVRVDPEGKMTFRVVRRLKGADGITASVAPSEPDINESWMCPPACG